MTDLREMLARVATGVDVPVLESECSCTECAGFCARRPCWATPDDARRLIDAGYGDKLMIDYWEGDRYDDEDEDILLLCPAAKGFEGFKAPAMEGFAFWVKMLPLPCVFLNAGLCELHQKGLKPSEGRYAHHDNVPTSERAVHHAIAQMWNNTEGQQLVEDWKARHGR